jgi:hypothetical protein
MPEHKYVGSRQTGAPLGWCQCGSAARHKKSKYLARENTTPGPVAESAPRPGNPHDEKTPAIGRGFFEYSQAALQVAELIHLFGDQVIKGHSALLTVTFHGLADLANNGIALYGVRFA